MEHEKFEEIKWKLREIACSDADMIESNDYEVCGEDEHGRSGCCTIQINKVCQEALDLINLISGHN